MDVSLFCTSFSLKVQRILVTGKQLNVLKLSFWGLVLTFLRQQVLPEE
jgi:hypothetical protein